VTCVRSVVPVRRPSRKPTYPGRVAATRARQALAATAALVVGCGVAAAGCSGSATTGTVIRSSDRSAAPAVQGVTLDGSPVALRNYAPGKVVVLNVWAQWCNPCRAEADALEEVASTTADLGVAFLGVDVRDDRAAARAYVSDHGISYPSLYDQAGAIPAQFRKVPPTAIPSTLVLDRQGRVAALFTSPVRVEDLAPVVRQVAAEKAT
jgi:thiol-disulfide isomerase/thioredoxin